MATATHPRLYEFVEDAFNNLLESDPFIDAVTNTIEASDLNDAVERALEDILDPEEYATTESIDNLQENLDDLESNVSEAMDSVNDLGESLADIENELEFLRERVEQLENTRLSARIKRSWAWLVSKVRRSEIEVASC